MQKFDKLHYVCLYGKIINYLFPWLVPTSLFVAAQGNKIYPNKKTLYQCFFFYDSNSDYFIEVIVQILHVH